MTIIRCTLAILFCSTAKIGWGQGTSNTIFEDDFSSLSSINNSYPVTSLTNWRTFLYCKRSFNINLSNPALRIERERQKSPTPVEGYATTDALYYIGDAYLSFSHAHTAKDKPTKAKVILSEDAVFKETNSNCIEVDVSSYMTTRFNSTTLHILNISNNTTITFQSTSDDYYAIDNVKVTKIPVISLTESDDNNNNDKTIENNNENVVMVEMSRTLTGGIWNTLCLPFDVTMEDMKLALGEGQNIKMRTFSSYADKVMTFAEATAVSAGTPFLIKLNTTVVNPTFHAVTVKNTTAQTVTSNGVSFVGTYSPVPLNTNGTNLFITKNNTLALPAEGMNIMNGLRAYIVVPEDFDSSGARLMMDDGETAAVSELVPSTEEAKPEAIYNLKGQRVEDGRRGLYVINGKLTLVK